MKQIYIFACFSFTLFTTQNLFSMERDSAHRFLINQSNNEQKETSNFSSDFYEYGKKIGNGIIYTAAVGGVCVLAYYMRPSKSQIADYYYYTQKLIMETASYIFSNDQQIPMRHAYRIAAAVHRANPGQRF